MTRTESSLNFEFFIRIALAAMIVLVVMLQSRSLYEFPQPDGARWWGDETGQMLELRAELRDGYARIPTALGSSLAVTNGLVRGNSWLAAFLYGFPAIVFSHFGNLVAIGRSVTLLLSLALLGVMYAMLRAWEVPKVLTLFSILLLVAARSFFFASHSARLDIAAGLAVLMFAWYAVSRDKAFHNNVWNPSTIWYVGFGAAILLSATLSIHLLTLIPPMAIVLLWRLNAFRRPAAIGSVLLGVVIIAGVLLGIYSLSHSPYSTFSPSSGTNQFQSVVSKLPVLRPFSRSVQTANILERIHGFWNEAPEFLLFSMAALLIVILFRHNGSKPNRKTDVVSFVIAAALAWLLLQSPALYYYLHVLPLFTVALTIGIARRIPSHSIFNLAMLILACVICYGACTDALRAKETSDTIAYGNRSALAFALSTIQSNHPDPRPVVLAQNPAIAMLEHDSTVRLMTAHVIDFPTLNTPLSTVLMECHVKYILVYAPHDGVSYSEDYHVLRPLADTVGTVLARIPGTLFDFHRDYFHPGSPSTLDTLILYTFPTIAH